MVLTQFSTVKAKPAEKPYKLSDGGGLHLFWCRQAGASSGASAIALLAGNQRERVRGEGIFGVFARVL
jgi:hypothetical protein